MEPCADLEEMGEGIPIFVGVGVIEAGMTDLKKIFDAGLEFFVGAGGRQAAGKVEFDPVTGGKNNHFFKRLMEGEKLQHREEIIAGQGELLADVDGHGAMVNADAVKIHE